MQCIYTIHIRIYYMHIMYVYIYIISYTYIYVYVEREPALCRDAQWLEPPRSQFQKRACCDRSWRKKRMHWPQIWFGHGTHIGYLLKHLGYQNHGRKPTLQIASANGSTGFLFTNWNCGNGCSTVILGCLLQLCRQLFCYYFCLTKSAKWTWDDGASHQY